MKKILLAVLFLVIFQFGASAETAGSLDSYIDEAVNNNPQLKSSYLKWQAAEHRITPAGTLPDPMVSYTHFGANVETRVGPQEAKYGVSQKVPYPAKLSLKSKSASAEAEVLERQYLAARDELVKNVRWVYYDLYWVDRAISIAEEEKSILENVEKVASKKYETNQAVYQDVVKAQAELSRLIDKLVMLKQNRIGLAARFNAFLNRPADTKIATIGELSYQRISKSLEMLRDMAQQNRPEISAKKFEVEKAGFEKSLANLNYVPDMTVGFDYIDVGSGHTTMPNDGQDAWMAMVAFNVPIWIGSINEDIKAKKAALEAMQNSYQDVENNVVADVEDLYYKLKAYEDVVNLYETALIPQATQAFEAVQKGYESGTTDFLNWLDAERVLLQARLAYYRSFVDYHKTLALLERVVGVSLSGA